MRIKQFGGGVKPSPIKKIFWVIPTYSGETWVEYTMAYGQCMGLLATMGIECETFPVIGDTFIEKARNRAVAKFMSDPTNEKIIMCDPDQAFTLQTFYDLLTSEHEFTAACPPFKKENKEFSTDIESPVEGKFFKTSRVGTGFVSFHRSVFEKMFVEYADRRN